MLPTTEKKMASALENCNAPRTREPVAVIDAAEFDAARRDPRVQRFLADSDRYLAELQAQGRNR